MTSIASCAKNFFSHPTKEQIKEANQGTIYARWIKKAKIGIRTELTLIPTSIAIILITTNWNELFVNLPLNAKSKAIRIILPNFSLFDVAIITPIREETLFRGLMQPILIRQLTRLKGGEKDEWHRHAKMAAIMGQAAFFGGMHSSFAQQCQTAFGGIVYGILKEKCAYDPSKTDEQRGWIAYLALRPVYFIENLLPSIFAHATNNALACTMLYVIKNAVTKT